MINALIFINLYFIGRLIFYNTDRIISGYNKTSQNKNNYKSIFFRLIIGIPIFILIAPLLLALYYFILLVILICLDSLIFFRDKRALFFWYAITLIIPFTTLIIKPPFKASHNTGLLYLYIMSEKISAIFLYYLLGYILLIKEGTIIIRFFLGRLKIGPLENTDQNINNLEYEHGKWIGILERTFIYFSIILGRIEGITIVIALKSIARFRELRDRAFAEYFLIGTLLSILIASASGVIIRIITSPLH